MKILLVAPDTSYLPLGMAFISASMKRSGHDVDCCYYGDHPSYLRRDGNRYDFIGSGGMSSQLVVMRRIRSIAVDHGAGFLCGGVIISADTEKMSALIGLREGDYGIVGEGELTVVELLAGLSRQENLDHIEGLVFYRDGRYIQTPPRYHHPDINSLPRPDIESFGYERRLDAARPSDVYYMDIFDHPREYPLVTSRTCPFSCTFCYQPSRRKYRVRDLDDVFVELEESVHRYRINLVGIYDELFHLRDDRLLDFCRRFEAFRKTVPWDIRWSCQARVTNITDEILAAMAKSGCFGISYGIESASQPILDSMRKKISFEQIDRVVSATIRHGISVQGNFLFGDIEETIDTAQQTLDYWKTHPDYGIVLYWIIPVPGSSVYHYAMEHGYLGDLEDFLINRYFMPVNFTKLSDSAFYEIGRRVFQYKMLYIRWQLRKSRTEDSVTFDCPFCDSENIYKNYNNSRFYFQSMFYCRQCRRRFYGADRVYRLYAWIMGHIMFVWPMYRFYVSVNYVLRRVKKKLRHWLARLNRTPTHVL